MSKLAKNQVCLITGGARGIGRAIVEEVYAQDGLAVVVDRKAEDLERTLGEWRTAGMDLKRILTVPIDVTGTDAPAEIIKRAVDWAGSVHSLVNCAGITRDKCSWKMTDQLFDEVLAVNARAPFRLSREFVVYLRGRKDTAPAEERLLWNIVNVSSIIGMRGAFGQANYAAAKHALIGITQVMGKELAEIPIRVNAVCPGYTETPMTEDMPTEVLQRIVPTIPMKRRAKAPEISNVVVAVMSPAFSYVTCAHIPVDGGITACIPG